MNIKKISVLSIIFSLTMFSGVFARLVIQTDIMNAVQHIKEVVITVDGTAG